MVNARLQGRLAQTAPVLALLKMVPDCAAEHCASVTAFPLASPSAPHVGYGVDASGQFSPSLFPVGSELLACRAVTSASSSAGSNVSSRICHTPPALEEK